MLIAIMAETYSRVANQAELVAQCGRAALILEYETAEIARLKRHFGRSRGSGRMNGADEHGHSFFADLLEDGSIKRQLEQVCPRWLHILMPAEHTRGDEATPEEKQSKLLATVEQLGIKQARMLEAVERRDDSQSEKRIMNTLRTELKLMQEQMMAALGK